MLPSMCYIVRTTTLVRTTTHPVITAPFFRATLEHRPELIEPIEKQLGRTVTTFGPHNGGYVPQQSCLASLAPIGPWHPTSPHLTSTRPQEFTRLGSFGSPYMFGSSLVNSQDRSYLLRAPEWARGKEPVQAGAGGGLVLGEKELGTALAWGRQDVVRDTMEVCEGRGRQGRPLIGRGLL